MPEEKELAGLRREMEKLADHLDTDLGDLESEVVGNILRRLLEGAMATTIISEFGLISEGDTGV